jgi:hypothetical protein
LTAPTDVYVRVTADSVGEVAARLLGEVVEDWFSVVVLQTSVRSIVVPVVSCDAVGKGSCLSRDPPVFDSSMASDRRWLPPMGKLSNEGASFCHRPPDVP